MCCPTTHAIIAYGVEENKCCVNIRYNNSTCTWSQSWRDSTYRLIHSSVPTSTSTKLKIFIYMSVNSCFFHMLNALSAVLCMGIPTGVMCSNFTLREVFAHIRHGHFHRLQFDRPHPGVS